LKKEVSLRDALEATNGGYLTIVVLLNQWKDFRTRHFALNNRVTARTLKGVKFSPVVLVTAPDEGTYIEVTRAIGNYSVVAPNGEFLPPATVHS
jgi:hypothetical protein